MHSSINLERMGFVPGKLGKDSRRKEEYDTIREPGRGRKPRRKSNRRRNAIRKGDSELY